MEIKVKVTKEQRREYVTALRRISFKTGTGARNWQFARATAAQRGEAFLRVYCGVD